MKNVVSKLLLAVALMASTALIASAKEELPYSEGPVTEISYIKIKPGMGDAYMSWLASDWKKLNEEYKKAGIILESHVYALRARTPHDADLMLCIVYKNMAALDNLDDRTEAIDAKFWGTRKKANEATVSRESMREVLGSELVQEMLLK